MSQMKTGDERKAEREPRPQDDIIISLCSEEFAY